jgi:hypothetical protein
LIKFEKKNCLNLPTHTLHTNLLDLPEHWNQIAHNNLFLKKEFLEVLQISKPKNMQCYYVSICNNGLLVAVAIMQLLEVQNLESFGDRDSCLKKKIRDFIFRNFAGTVLLIGNNLLTGQNAYASNGTISETEIFKTLSLAAAQLKDKLAKKNKKVHLTVFKDFKSKEDLLATTKVLPNYYSFSVQPNMGFEVKKDWIFESDYVANLSKKYRDQYKRARKKSADIYKKQLNLSEIKLHHKTIYTLYRNVAKNAPFNTFYLAENHFETLKEKLGEDFLIYGYFLDRTLIGFNTLLKNGSTLETYFLGYDSEHQKDKMLYLNMLYDMIGFAITKKYQSIIFGRTALEIKSSVGAKPENSFGFIMHSSKVIQPFMPKFFTMLEPKTEWIQRHPYKE